MAVNIVERVDDSVRVSNVLISVSDKSGLDTLVPGLVAVNPDVKIYSTGGTFTRVADILGEHGAEGGPREFRASFAHGAATWRLSLGPQAATAGDLEERSGFNVNPFGSPPASQAQEQDRQTRQWEFALTDEIGGAFLFFGAKRGGNNLQKSLKQGVRLA